MESLDKKKELLRKLLNEEALKKRKFGLSQGQKSMWFLQSLNKNSIDYNSGFAVKIKGELDIKLFSNCVKELGNRHAILRSAIEENENGEYQEIRDEAVCLDYIQLRDNVDKEVIQLIDQKLKEVYNLEQGNLARPTLFEIDVNEYVFLFSFHHIIYDEWTSRIILVELIKMYHEKQNFPNFELPVIEKGYKDFVTYQEQIMEDPELISFWKNYLDNHDSAILEFSGDKEFLENSSKSSIGGVIKTEIPPVLMESVRELCKKNRVTVFNFMITATQIAIYKYTEQDQFFIGTPVAGRNNSDFHQTAGYFVNLVPIKCSIDQKESFSSFLDANAKNNNLVLGHQDFPFNRMVESFYGDRSLSKHPFFNVAFTYYNQKRLQEDLSDVLSGMDKLSFEEYDLNSQESVFDITIEVKELSESGTLKVKFNTSKYSENMMSDFSTYLIQLIEHLITSEDETIQKIIELESCHDISESQGEERNTFSTENVLDVFKNQVQCYPNKIAVKDGEIVRTYSQLLEDIELIHSQIVQYVTIGRTKIGLLTDSSLKMVQGIFSILSAGASYVPIKTELPSSRFSFMVENSGIELLLCDKANFNKQAPFDRDITVICIEDLLDQKINHRTIQTIEIGVNSPAYLMYTSGSTGTPKGVQITHSNILNLVKNQNYVCIKNGDNIPQLSDYSFDGSIFDIFGTLLNGATLHIIDQKTIESTDELLSYFNDNSVNIGFFTTALFNTLVGHDAARFLSTFDRILFGGEQVSTKHVQTALKFVKNDNVLVHVYGPTETTTYATYFPIRSIKENAKTIPIGRALSGVNVSIRSKNGILVPIGVVGEICIKGRGVANGYYGKESSDKFRFDPLDPTESLYVTGDFGFMTLQGDIVFTGRKDHQIKLRGFRIELGEIEAALYQCENIGKAVAFISNNNTERSMIVAAVEPIFGGQSEDHLRKELLSFLPDFMIPSKIIVLEHFKLNKNAKIDRTILLERVNDILANDVLNIQRPSTETEKTLITIWSEIFEIEDIGVNQSFFILGGNSLLAMRVLSRIKYIIGVELSPVDIFETPTIMELGFKIDKISVQKPGTNIIKRSNREKYLI